MGQRHRRRVRGVVQHGLVGGDHVDRGLGGLAGAEVARVHRVRSARDLHADAVPGGEAVPDRPHRRRVRRTRRRRPVRSNGAVNRWRPSHTLSDVPSGCTSHTRTNTSTWSRLDVTWSSADTGPISSSGSANSSPVYTSTSAPGLERSVVASAAGQHPDAAHRRRRVGGVVAVPVGFAGGVGRVGRRADRRRAGTTASAWPAAASRRSRATCRLRPARARSPGARRGARARSRRYVSNQSSGASVIPPSPPPPRCPPAPMRRCTGAGASRRIA